MVVVGTRVRNFGDLDWHFGLHNPRMGNPTRSVFVSQFMDGLHRERVSYSNLANLQMAIDPNNSC